MSASQDTRSTRREESSDRKTTLVFQEELAKAKLKETLFLNNLNNSMDARERKELVEFCSTGEITITEAGNIKISSHPLARFEKGYLHKHPYDLKSYVIPPSRHMALTTAAWRAQRDLSLWKEQLWNKAYPGGKPYHDCNRGYCVICIARDQEQWDHNVDDCDISNCSLCDEAHNSPGCHPINPGPPQRNHYRPVDVVSAETCYSEAKRNPKRKKLAHMSPQGKAPRSRR